MCGKAVPAKWWTNRGAVYHPVHVWPLYKESPIVKPEGVSVVEGDTATRLPAHLNNNAICTCPTWQTGNIAAVRSPSYQSVPSSSDTPLPSPFRPDDIGTGWDSPMTHMVDHGPPRPYSWHKPDDDRCVLRPNYGNTTHTYIVLHVNINMYLCPPPHQHTCTDLPKWVGIVK